MGDSSRMWGRSGSKAFGQTSCVPPAQWFRGPLRELVYDTLRSPSFLGRGMVSPDFVRYMLAEHDRGRRNNQSYIYQLLMLELWFKTPEEPVSSPTESLVC